MATPKKAKLAEASPVRKRAVIRNMDRGQMVTCRLDGPYLGYPGPNGVGQPETLTFLGNERKHLDVAVLRCGDVQGKLRTGVLRKLREYMPVPGDSPVEYDLTPAQP